LSLFRNLFNSLSDADTFLNPSLCDSGFGIPTTAGERIDPHNAETISTYNIMIRAASEDIGRTPIVLLKEDDDGDSIEQRDDPRWHLVTRQPNPNMNADTFWGLMERYSRAWGIGLAEIQRDEAKNPIAFYHIPSWNLHSIGFREQDNQIIAFYNIRQPDGSIRILEQEDSIALPGPGDNGYIGHTVAQLAAQSLGLSKALENFGAAFFANGASPKTLITVDKPMNDKQAAAFKKSWAAMRPSSR
jgi:HK97 family phage portal protein